MAEEQTPEPGFCAFIELGIREDAPSYKSIGNSSFTIDLQSSTHFPDEQLKAIFEVARLELQAKFYKHLQEQPF